MDKEKFLRRFEGYQLYGGGSSVEIYQKKKLVHSVPFVVDGPNRLNKGIEDAKEWIKEKQKSAPQESFPDDVIREAQEGIYAKLLEYDAKDLSDEEITRCLENTVLANKLIVIAKQLRDAGLNIDDVRNYNFSTGNTPASEPVTDKSWNCYAKGGNENYKKLDKFKKTYGFAVGNCLMLLTGGTILRDSGADDLRIPFEQGKFEVKKWKEAVQFAEICKGFSDFPAWNSRAFIIAIGRILKADLCDFNVLMKKYSRDPKKLVSQPNWKMYVNNLELIYNYDNSKRRPII